MTRKTRFNLAQALVVGGTALLALSALSSRRPEGTPQPPARREVRTSSPQAAPLPQPEPSNPAQPAELLSEIPAPQPAPVPAAIPAAAPSVEVAENPDALAGWLLALPDAELTKLIGTPTLDGWVSRVAGHLAARAGENPEPPELMDFLTRLNGRIEVLRRG